MRILISIPFTLCGVITWPSLRPASDVAQCLLSMTIIFSVQLPFILYLFVCLFVSLHHWNWVSESVYCKQSELILRVLHARIRSIHRTVRPTSG